MKWTLPKKAVVATACLLLPIGVAFLLNYFVQKDFLHKQALGNFRMISSTDELRLQSFLEKSLQRVIDFSSDGFLKQMVKEIGDGNQEASGLLSAHLVQNKLPLSASLEAVHVLFLDGRVIASTEKPRMGKNFAARGFFKKLAEGEYFSEEPGTVKGTGLAASVYIVEPRSSKPIGIMTTFINLSELKVDDDSHANIYRGIRRYIVNRNGRLVAGTSSAFEMERAGKIVTSPVRACLEGGKDLAGGYLDPAGKRVLGGSACVQELGWTIVAEVDEQAALEPIDSMLRSFIMVGAFTVVLVIGFHIAFLTLLTRRVKSLSLKMTKVSSGNYSVIQNEGADEISELTESFNAMVRELEKRDDALLRGEIKYKMIHETLFVGVILADAEGKILGSTLHVEDLLDYSAAELTGLSLEVLLPGLPANNSLREHAGPGSADRPTKKFETEAVRKNGMRLLVEVAIGGFSVEGEFYFSISITDISEQKAFRSELSETREIYRALFLDSKDMIFECSSDGVLLETNPAGAGFLGYGSIHEALEDKPLLFSTADMEKLAKGISADGFIKNYETKLKGRTGKILTVFVTASPILDERAELCGYKGIIHDITKLKNYEFRLLHSHKIEAIGRLAGEISHEFNNILSIITGYATLLNSANLNVTEKMWLQNLLSTSEKAMHVTGGLLACSRKRPFSPRRHDLNSLVENFYRLLAEIFVGKIDFRVNFQEGDICVKVDKIHIEQVLLNLVNNARDAMPEGGIISIKTKTEQIDSEIAEMFGVPEGDYAAIVLEDNGMGMDKESLENIFEPFYTTKKVGEGTGLGLSIVYRIISEHKGFIRVVSAPGRGTAFYLYLPLVDRSAADNVLSLREASALYL